MMQTTKDCLRGDPPTGRFGLWQSIVNRDALPDTLMWSFLIVVSHVFLNRPLQMLPIMDKDMIQTFSA